MPRKRTTRRANGENPIVNFSFQDRTYQIDPERRKVYQRFVEIETSKALQIFAQWRAQNASA